MKLSTRYSRLFSFFNITKSTFYRHDANRMDFDYDDYCLIRKYFLRSKQKHGIRQLRMAIERSEGLVINEKKIIYVCCARIFLR